MYSPDRELAPPGSSPSQLPSPSRLLRQRLKRHVVLFEHRHQPDLVDAANGAGCYLQLKEFLKLRNPKTLRLKV